VKSVQAVHDFEIGRTRSVPLFNIHSNTDFRTDRPVTGVNCEVGKLPLNQETTFLDI
jgi:hypothetical protein